MDLFQLRAFQCDGRTVLRNNRTMNLLSHVITLIRVTPLYINLVRASQETHCVSTTEPNRLMLFREIIDVYRENHTEHINTLRGQNAEFISYLTGNTLRLRHKAQPVNAV
jgi:hypothetical protein